MLFKQLTIPLDDLRLTNPDLLNQPNSPMASDQSYNALEGKQKENEKIIISEVSDEEESEEEYKVEDVKSIKKLVKILSSDSEDNADRCNSKRTVKKPKDQYHHSIRQKKVTEFMEEKSSDSDGSPSSEEEESSDYKSPSSEEDNEKKDPDFHQKKTVKKHKEQYQRHRSRQKKVTKHKKEESDVSPSSEEDNENTDPDFDIKKEEEKIKQRIIKEAKRSAPETFFVKKEPMSEYERMIQKNRMEKMAFLESLKIDEVKAGFSEIVESVSKKKVQPVKRSYRKVEKPTSPPVLRKSRRLANININLSEDTLYYNALNTVSVEKKHQKAIPPEITFKAALESEDFYKSYKVAVNIQESKPEAKFTIYDKSVLSKMSLSESNIAKVTPMRITALTWHPSPEQMIIAAGDKKGQLGIWNVESGNPHIFKIHLEGITNLQFNTYNQTQLISSSYDGILRYGDLVQHNFCELYNISEETGCTYFDVLSATTYLVSQRNGQVALVDLRTRNKNCQKKHECHDCPIKTVNIHPTNKNFFVTAENKGSIRLWDLRKLQSTPVADITHHKRCVQSAFFSPVTGNSILTLSADDSISIFDSKILASDIKVRVQMKHNNCTGRWLSTFKATWLPNSEETFAVGSMLSPRRIEIYDKNMFVYSLMMHENFTTITSVNAFHPTRPALAGANSSGKVFVFI